LLKNDILAIIYIEGLNTMDQGPFSEKEYNEAISNVNNLVHLQ